MRGRRQHAAHESNYTLQSLNTRAHTRDGRPSVKRARGARRPESVEERSERSEDEHERATSRRRVVSTVTASERSKTLHESTRKKMSRSTRKQCDEDGGSAVQERKRTPCERRSDKRSEPQEGAVEHSSTRPARARRAKRAAGKSTSWSDDAVGGKALRAWGGRKVRSKENGPRSARVRSWRGCTRVRCSARLVALGRGLTRMRTPVCDGRSCAVADVLAPRCNHVP